MALWQRSPIVGLLSGNRLSDVLITDFGSTVGVRRYNAFRLCGDANIGKCARFIHRVADCGVNCTSAFLDKRKAVNYAVSWLLDLHCGKLLGLLMSQTQSFIWNALSYFWQVINGQKAFSRVLCWTAWARAHVSIWQLETFYRPVFIFRRVTFTHLKTRLRLYPRTKTINWQFWQVRKRNPSAFVNTNLCPANDCGCENRYSDATHQIFLCFSVGVACCRSSRQ